ncbi:MAG: hypothetical protein KJO61_05180 [Deltaproteobacteria bacterium]|nr:hypothetical protein [Deltaproteobacteria bacterium]NNL31909.1 hypothetical protein [Flavobacteriaceae bacterium]
MNRCIEIHDSTLFEVIEDDEKIILRFNRAYIHQSEGKPGIDSGTGWGQEIALELTKAKIIVHLKSIPVNLTNGYIKIGQIISQNCIDLPIKESGNIELWFQTVQNEEIKIRAQTIISRELNKAEYIEEFKV